MTAIATRTTDNGHVAVYDPALNALAAWAESARAASLVAGQLAGTPFVPKTLRGVRTRSEQTQDDLDRITVGNVTAAILTGQELGLQPMAALRSMDIIEGTPALRAITLRALVQAHGHEVWLEESTETRAIVSGRRKGTDKVQTSKWTLDRAKALNLTHKDNWKKQPGAMLIARASSECCRLVAADVIMAMPYSVEELYDGDEWAAVEESPARPAPARRTAQRKTTPPPAAAHPEVKPEETVEAAEPGFDDDEPVAEAVEEPAEQEPPDPITQSQSTKLHATFNDFGIKSGDREQRLRVSAAIVGRGVATSNDLTKAEASSLIDTLDGILASAQENGEDPLEQLLLIVGDQ